MDASQPQQRILSCFSPLIVNILTPKSEIKKRIPSSWDFGSPQVIDTFDISNLKIL